MHHSFELTLARVDRYAHDYLARAVVARRCAVDVAAWEVTGSANGARPPLSEVLTEARFTPIAPGESWGPPWTTTWLRVRGEVPAHWGDTGTRVELSLDLGFSDAKPGFQCEGLVRTPEGHAVKGLEPRNHSLWLQHGPEEPFEFYVEAAANPDLTGGNDFKGPFAFAPTRYGDVLTAPSDPLYRWGAFELRLIDTEVEMLMREVVVLRGLASELAATDPRRAAIIIGLAQALDLLDPDDPARDASTARARLLPLLTAPASASAHRILATGHAHIDTAWLWPLRETVRKVLRTFANVLDLMDTDPEVTFTASAAQHFAWVSEADPLLFARLRERVKEGRFVVAGGMWVESDVNMPNGESIARQLLYGCRFFTEAFDIRCQVGWLPDSFGYSGAIPQLLRQAGMEWFFAQKMCWNETNTMPHHTFIWEGIDGSRIFTHFPPVDTYSGDMRPTELARSARNFADHGASTVSLMPFGYGDGGGGPTREMVTDARLQANLEGSARVAFATPMEFFATATDEYHDPPVWSGELYLEFHRGVYTAQARTKRGNRRNEGLLLEAELWCATAALCTGARYPYEELDEAWREVLTLQFHDILPGSSIAWVHREAEATHARVTEVLERLIVGALAALGRPCSLAEGTESALRANPAPVEVAGVPAHAIARGIDPVVVSTQVTESGVLRLVSPGLVADIAPDGTLRSFIDRASGRDLIAQGQSGNVLQWHVDAPAVFDAWELDGRYQATHQDLPGRARVEGEGTIVVNYAFESSTVEQRISLDPSGEALRILTRVDWHERHRFLKLAFPFDLAAPDAAYETQFGFVRRPLHTNTSWDEARYEVCAHRWVHIGEPGFGVAVVNDAVYGHDVTRKASEGRFTTTVRQSLLRAPTFPDPQADQGTHTFLTVLAPAATPAQATSWGARVAAPLRAVGVGVQRAPLVSLDEGSSAIISAVKLAADRSGDVIVRLYEQQGSRTTAILRTSFALASAHDCGLLEDEPASPESDLTWVDAVLQAASDQVLSSPPGVVRLELRPFGVRTLRLRPDSRGGAR